MFLKIKRLLRNIGIRVQLSNNRTLATLFGCVLGLALGIVIVLQNEEAFQIVGRPSQVFYKIIGVLLAMGTGGNLSSYIGAAIDIITGEKTLFDLYGWMAKHLKQGEPKNLLSQASEPTGEEEMRPRHFPFITSSDRVPNISTHTGHPRTITPTSISALQDEVQQLHRRLDRRLAKIRRLEKEKRDLKKALGTYDSQEDAEVELVTVPQLTQ